MSMKSTLVLALALIVAIAGAGGLVAWAIRDTQAAPAMADNPVITGGPAGGIPAAIDAQEARTLTVTSTSSVEVEPDFALLYVSFNNEYNSSAEQALNKINEDLQAAIDALMALGVAPGDIQTSNLGCSSDKYNTPTRYRADASLNVKIRDLSKIGEMLDAATAMPSFSYSHYSFDVQDKVAAYEQAVQNAAQEAEFKAQTMAADMGLTLGDILVVEDPDNYYGTPLGLASAADRADSVVMTGTVSISASVRVTYELK